MKNIKNKIKNIFKSNKKEDSKSKTKLSKQKAQLYERHRKFVQQKDFNSYDRRGRFMNIHKGD